MDRRVVDGVVEYLVQYEGYASPEWQPEKFVDGCDEKLRTFYGDPSKRAAECKYGHHEGVCRCHLPLLHSGQDESIYHAYACSRRQWIINGIRALRKKTNGPGEMMSAFQDQQRGFGFPMTADELAQVCPPIRITRTARADRPRRPSHLLVR